MERFLIWMTLVELVLGSYLSAQEQRLVWPVPPQQKAEWQLPEEIEDPKEKIAKTISLLFELGLPDPRGLAYHHLEVREDGKVLSARGWVLPAKAAGEQRFAIGWSGLIYPVISVGQPADLQEDIKILRKQGRFGKEPFDNYQDEILDDLIARFGEEARMMHPFAASFLLLRLGEAVETEETKDRPDPFTVDSDREGLFVLNFESEEDLHWLLFHYAMHIRSDGVAAFVGRDDRVAARRLGSFDHVWNELMKRVPPEDERREPDPFDPFAGPEGFRASDVNASWQEVLLDAKRRIENSDPVAGDSELERLIASWENLESWDENVPPIEFQKVVSFGELAIKPLLECLESDRRWTRIVTERVQYGRRPIRVRELAAMALERILKFDLVEHSESEGPPESVFYDEESVKMRSFCERYDYETGGELWYRILNDEESRLYHQVQAAIAIVVPEDAGEYYGVTGLYLVTDSVRERCDTPNASWEGAALRDSRQPSVLVLLERALERERKRVEKRLEEGEPEATIAGLVYGPVYLRGRVQLLMRCMEEWNPGNLEILRSHYRWLEKGLMNQRRQKNEDEALGVFVLERACEEILIRRFWSDDKTAMDDYKRLWRDSMVFGNLPAGVMIEFPGFGGMDALLAEALLNEGAPYRFSDKPWTDSDPRKQLITQGRSLMVNPSFRKALVQGLRNRVVQGSFWKEEGDLMVAFVAEQGEDSSHFFPNVGLRRKSLGEERIKLRMCDLVADALTPSYGFEKWLVPDFRIDDPIEKRDEAIADWIRRLDR